MDMTLKEQLLPFTSYCGNASVEGAVYRYRALRPDFHPDAPHYFVDWQGNEFLVSDQIPVEYLRAVLVHEVYCHFLYAGQRSRCRRALQQELAEVPASILADYLRFRITYFQQLLADYEQQPAEEVMEELLELRETLGYLLGLAAAQGVHDPP